MGLQSGNERQAVAPFQYDHREGNYPKGDEITMRLTTVIEGVFTKEQKSPLVEKITEAIIEVEGERMRPLTWVGIEEVKSGDWAIGGKPVFFKTGAR